jgi:hypothetical protein
MNRLRSTARGRRSWRPLLVRRDERLGIENEFVFLIDLELRLRRLGFFLGRRLFLGRLSG